MESGKKKKIVKRLLIVGVIGLVVGGSVFAYFWFMPHRDVKNTVADHSIKGVELVEEYLKDADAANEKYLAEDGDSDIFEVVGTVSDISENQNGQAVILLKGEGDKAGMSCTFIKGEKTSGIQLGTEIKIKGKIEVGASYDEDFEEYMDVVMGECSLV